MCHGTARSDCLGEIPAEGLLGLIRLGLYWGYIRVILGIYWGYIGVILGIMEEKMETPIWSLGFRGLLPLLRVWEGPF